MCATFGVCSKFVILLVFQISGTQKSGNWKNAKNIVCLNRIRDLEHSADHLVAIQKCEHLHVFCFDFLSFLVSRIKAVNKRYGQAELGWLS